MFSKTTKTRLATLIVLQLKALMVAAVMAVGSPFSTVAAPENECDSVTLTTQAQVDAFDQSCEVINGYLTISGNDISDLSRLSNVQRVDALKVFFNPQLIDLSGLEALNTARQCLVIHENEKLQSLTGLEKLAAIGTALAGNGSCPQRGLSIYRNQSLSDLYGLKNLKDLGGALHIEQNKSLTDVQGLAALTDVVLDILEVRFNDVLVDLDGMEGLVGTDRLFIIDNHELVHVDALRNLRQTFATPTDGRKFEVIENWDLARCEGLAPFFLWPGNYLMQDVSWFEDNEPGCESLDQLWGSVVVTAPVVNSVRAGNGRMSVDFVPATVNTGLYPINGHDLHCAAFEEDPTTFTSPMRTIPDGETVTERHYFASEVREARQGHLSSAISAWSPYFKVWHPSPDELTATITTPSGSELLLLDRFDIAPDANGRMRFPSDVWATILGTEDQARIFPGETYYRDVEQELEGEYEITFTDSIVTASDGRLEQWGIFSTSQIRLNQIPATGSTVTMDSVLNEIEYRCWLSAVPEPLERADTEIEFFFTSELTLPQSAPQIVSVTPQADGEASILVEFSQPWAWHAELQDYLVTCEAEGEEPAYGYALADNGNANQVMAADGSVTQAILVEGVSEEVDYSCSVTGYNRRGGGPASAVANVTTEAVIRGLPIWLLYEAARAP